MTAICSQLEEQLAAWGGRASVALLVRTGGDDEPVTVAAAAAAARARVTAAAVRAAAAAGSDARSAFDARVALCVIDDASGAADDATQPQHQRAPYPINTLRNVALLQVRFFFTHPSSGRRPVYSRR